MSRKRFKLSRLASSDNYYVSKRIHKRELERNHKEHQEYFESISISIDIEISHTNRTPYIRVWGKLMRITPDMVETFEGQIIWK